MKINTKIIDDFLIRQKMTKKEFCKKCKISTKTLSKMYNGEINLRCNTYLRLVTFLNVKSKDLIGF